MLARPMNFLEIRNESLLPQILRLFLQHLAIADDGVEGSAQLMGHVGEELGFVLVGDLKLLTLVFDLPEQPRVLYGENRLRRQGLHEIYNLCREIPCLTTIDGQSA